MSPQQSQELRLQLRSFITDNFLFGREGTPMGDDESLVEKGIIDSTGVLELTSFLEQQYGVSVSDDELAPENLDSIANLTRFICAKQGQVV